VVSTKWVTGFLVRGRYTHKNVDRAIEDIGFPTPAGSEAYIIGNPGFGLAKKVGQDLGFQTPRLPAGTTRLKCRLTSGSRTLFLQRKLHLQRLWGNYSGLASSLEFGRTSPNVSRLFDLPFQPFTTRRQVD